MKHILTHLLRFPIGVAMEFGISKYAGLIMKTDERGNSQLTHLPESEIKFVDPERCKYIGDLEVDYILIKKDERTYDCAIVAKVELQL